jgi:hypothetical protein
MSNLNTLSLKSNLNTPALITTNSNVFVNSILSTGKDVVCGGVVRTNVIQLGTCDLPVSGSYTPGIYGYNGKLLFSEQDSMVLGDMSSGVVNMPSLTPAGYTKQYLANSFFIF